MLHPEQEAESQNSEHALPDFTLTIILLSEGGITAFNDFAAQPAIPAFQPASYALLLQTLSLCALIGTKAANKPLTTTPSVPRR
jgi:hypothetical protein